MVSILVPFPLMAQIAINLERILVIADIILRMKTLVEMEKIHNTCELPIKVLWVLLSLGKFLTASLS